MKKPKPKKLGNGKPRAYARDPLPIIDRFSIEYRFQMNLNSNGPEKEGNNA